MSSAGTSKLYSSHVCELRDPRCSQCCDEDSSFRGCYVVLIGEHLPKFQRSFVPPSSGSIIPRTLLRILKPEDAGTTFFEISVNIYNLVWHTISGDVYLNINFVWISYVWRNLKEEALYHTQWRTCFGRGYGPVIRHTKQRMN